MGIKREDYELVGRLYKELTPCTKDKTCLSVSLDAELRDFIARIPRYRKLMSEVNSASYDGDKRNAIDALHAAVARDHHWDAPYINDSLVSTQGASGLEISLPMLAPRLTDSEKTFLKKHFEPRWKAAGVSVNVNFVDKSADSRPFALFVDYNPGGRAYVYQSDREMHLLPYTNTPALAHELGHVLGFSDHYYTTWDPATCEYTVEYSDEDIMSNHMSGSATAEEIAWLIKTYPAGHQYAAPDPKTK